jgi:hypothetical protein
MRKERDRKIKSTMVIKIGKLRIAPMTGRERELHVILQLHEYNWNKRKDRLL